MHEAPCFYDIRDLSSVIKTKLIEAYDEYIQGANDDDRFASGWRPVCIHEFLNNEFLEILEEYGYQIVVKNN